MNYAQCFERIYIGSCLQTAADVDTLLGSRSIFRVRAWTTGMQSRAFRDLKVGGQNAFKMQASRLKKEGIGIVFCLQEDKDACTS